MWHKLEVWQYTYTFGNISLKPLTENVKTDRAKQIDTKHMHILMWHPASSALGKQISEIHPDKIASRSDSINVIAATMFSQYHNDGGIFRHVMLAAKI